MVVSDTLEQCNTLRSHKTDKTGKAQAREDEGLLGNWKGLLCLCTRGRRNTPTETGNVNVVY